MTTAEAQILAGKLAAAFPRDWAFVGEATNSIYVERIARLQNRDAAVDAVDVLIDGEERLPTIARIRDEYKLRLPAYAPKQLEVGDFSEEEREANLIRARELASRFGRKVEAE